VYLQLGWRNIWRNPRRTVVILTAVVIGVWCMITLGALMRGMIDQMVRNGIATLTGHIQVHSRGYRNDPVIENSIVDPQSVEHALKELLPAGSRWSPRVRVNAVASNARHSGGVILVGIDPAAEAAVSFIGDAIAQGRYLRDEGKNGIIIGNALADEFETRLDRKLVVMSQGSDREIASRAFRIIGTFRAELEATEKQFVFVTIGATRQMLKLKKGISEISILLPDHQKADEVAAALQRTLPSEGYEVSTWKELLPLLTAYLAISENFLYLWFLVVFVAMGFGVVNTTLMAVFERMREFGLLKALGMKPRWIVREVLTESCLLLILGMAIGNIFALLTSFALSGGGIDLSALAAGMEYFGAPRIIYPVISGKDLVMANAVVFVLGLLVSCYPAIKAARFTPVEALAQT
jgi:ABC-type lipoprotein release transport system permease subunit